MDNNSNSFHSLIDSGLTGKTALVTGGARGIGRATCMALAAHGMQVGIHYQNQAEAAAEVAQVIQAAGGQAFAFQSDLAEASGPTTLVNAVIEQFGQIDVLINNAGEMTDTLIAEMPEAMWERSLAQNLTTAVRCARASLETMIPKRWGRIINITSQVTFNGAGNHAHYAASKSGLAGFSYSLAKEVGSYGVTVNLIAPGRIIMDTSANAPINQEDEWLQQTPLRRFGQPEEVAATAAFLASSAAGYITGATIYVNGGLVMG
ncbi:MAG: 3-oxoacyl-ACP reductase family protein [Chloroflexota bacterium]